MRRPVELGRKGGGGGRSRALKVFAGTDSPPHHPTVPMAPMVPLALLALVALLAPGLGVALPGCDYPVHLWCSSQEIAVACQVRAAGARAAPATHPRWQPMPGQGHLACGDVSHRNGTDGAGCLPGKQGWGVRGRCQGSGWLPYLVQVPALSIPAAQAGTPWGCSEPPCCAGIAAFPSIPREAPCCSQTPSPSPP